MNIPFSIHMLTPYSCISWDSSKKPAPIGDYLYLYGSRLPEEISITSDI